MRRKWFIVFGCGFVLSALYVYFVSDEEPSRESSVVKKGGQPFFISVPIESFTSRIPNISVTIEDKTFLMGLDLGFKGYLSLNKKYLKSIENKSPIPSKTMYNFRGNSYQNSCYEIPKVKVGQVAFSKLILQETDSQEEKDSILYEGTHRRVTSRNGFLGWKLFENTNLLLDYKNSQIAFFDNIETLRKQGYEIENFTKVPLLTDRGILEFIAQTDKGPIRCFLDTGSTLNLIPGEMEGTSFKEWIHNEKSHVHFPSFIIGGSEFGHLVFFKTPMQSPIDIEAVIGLVFLKDRLMFIDFSSKAIYFGPKEEKDPKEKLL